VARIFPDGWKTLEGTGGFGREIETLHFLARALPDAYTVYHSVHWTRVKQGSSAAGELDFVVVAPSGRLLVIEQKSGLLEETAAGLAKTYASGTKSVNIQLARSISALRTRLASAFGSGGYHIEELLYCPDYAVKNAAVAGIDPSRIVDAPKRDQLADFITRALPMDEPPLACQEKIHDFLADALSLVPDASAIAGSASTLVTQLSGGLATWARTIRFDPFRLRVIGTAGSGKTQLALSVLRDASASGQRALYVCFNRPLADHVRMIAPDDVQVMTFHQLGFAIASRQGVEIDFSRPEVFAELECAFDGYEPAVADTFDVIVVDEGQDFLQAWVAPLSRLLAQGGKWWWLEDPMQNLYFRPAVELPGWVEVHASANYRTPRDIIRFIRQLAGASFQIDAASPLDGSEVGFLSYEEGHVTEATKQALADAAALGFRPADITLLTFQGRDKSRLSNLDRLGEYALKSFTGEFDATGMPVYRDGSLLFDSVYRFKGQCAPCVILTEVDFPEFNENVLRRLFVGATRATVKLIIVASGRAAGELIARLG
jgi:hypothetical protein